MIAEKPRKAPPRDLQTRGKALWRTVVAAYQLNPAETALLHELCRTHDEIDELTVALRRHSPVVEGSRGPPRPNPLLAEVRQHRKLADQLAVALALPINGETVGARRSANAKVGAHARWRHGRGA